MTLDSRILFSKAVEELFGVNYTVINSKSCNFFFLHICIKVKHLYIYHTQKKQTKFTQQTRKEINQLDSTSDPIEILENHCTRSEDLHVFFVHTQKKNLGIKNISSESLSEL